MENNKRLSMIILICCSLVAAEQLFARQAADSAKSSPRHALFAELGGNGVVLTVNWEEKLTNNARLRVGFGTVLLGFGIPVTLTFHGSDNHQFVAGGGFVYAKGHLFDEFESFLLTGTVGYQYLPAKGGLFFRLAFTPLFNPDRNKFLPWAGLSLGKAF